MEIPKLGGAEFSRLETSNQHTVQKGETFNSIAQLYGLETETLLKINPQLQSIDSLEPGQVLNLSSPTASTPVQTDVLETFEKPNLFSQALMSLGESQPGMISGAGKGMIPGETQGVMIPGETQGVMIPGSQNVMIAAEGLSFKNLAQGIDFALPGEAQGGMIPSEGLALDDRSSLITETGLPKIAVPDPSFTPTSSLDKSFVSRLVGSRVIDGLEKAENQGEFNEKFVTTVRDILTLLEGDYDSHTSLIENLTSLGLSSTEAEDLIGVMRRGDAVGMAVLVAVASEVAKAQMGEAPLNNDQHVDLHLLAQLAANADQASPPPRPSEPSGPNEVTVPPGTLSSNAEITISPAAVPVSPPPDPEVVAQQILDNLTQSSEYGNNWSLEDLNQLAQKLTLPFGINAVVDFVNEKLNL